jgi:DNA-binding response OmpR family regulator
LQLDRVQCRVYVDGILLPKPLTGKQFEFLDFLATHAGKVCTRAETNQAVYGESYIPHRDDARLDALIERARLQIGDDQRPPRFIETVRGEGYRLNEYIGERSQM